jgi:hypothetical protein
MLDVRFRQLSPRLKRIRTSRYQPYYPDLWLWGRAYEVEDGRLIPIAAATFRGCSSIRSGVDACAGAYPPAILPWVIVPSPIR